MHVNKYSVLILIFLNKYVITHEKQYCINAKVWGSRIFFFLFSCSSLQQRRRCSPGIEVAKRKAQRSKLRRPQLANPTGSWATRGNTARIRTPGFAALLTFEVLAKRPALTTAGKRVKDHPFLGDAIIHVDSARFQELSGRVSRELI